MQTANFAAITVDYIKRVGGINDVYKWAINWVAVISRARCNFYANDK
jgi:hypothetical protein